MRRKPEKLETFIIAKAFYFALVLIVVLSSSGFGQSITWQRIIGNNYGSLYQAQQTNDGGYIAVGSAIINNNDKMYLTKLDPEGKTEWTKIIGEINTEGAWVIQTNDNGYAICGRTDTAGLKKFFLVKTDSLGNILWQKTYNVSDLDRANCIKQISDGGYFIVGYTFPSRTGIYIIKTDANGLVTSQKVYYIATESKVAKEFVVLNGFYYIIGDITSGNQTDQYVMKLNNKLDSIWTRRYGGANNDLGYSIDSINQNEIVITGSSNSYNPSNKYESVVCKIDTNGNIIWQRTYSGLGIDISRSIRVINESLYVISGSSDSLNNNTRKAKIRLIDYSGNVLFENSYLPGTVGAGFESTELTSDNGFISSGYVIQNGAVENMYIVKSDSLLKAEPIGLISVGQNIPRKFKIHQNYPNPFNPVTYIKLDIPRDANVSIKIYDLIGKEIFSVIEYKQAGTYELMFDGSKLASGLYFYSLETNGFKDTKRMVLIK